MAEWVDRQGEESPPEIPPELALYLKIRDWGDPWGRGWMRWPARMWQRVRLAGNVYNSWSGYAKTDAEKRIEWEKKNPGLHRVVGIVKSYRFESEPEAAGQVARWEQWMGLARARDDEIDDG